MNSILDFEPYELLPVAAMRCLAIVDHLGRSISSSSALTIEKAAIFDAVLKNPNIGKRLFSELAPEKVGAFDSLSVLYPNEAEYGLVTNTRNITKIAALLRHADLISIEKNNGILVLKPKSQQALIDLEHLPVHWKYTLKALKPLLSKSVGTLQQAVIRESKNHAEQHVFIARKADSQRGYEEL